MKSVVPLPDEIKIEQVDFAKFLEDYSYYREIVFRYHCFADTIIVPGTSLSGEILTAACCAKRKIGLARSFPVKNLS